ncbi:MAG: hypothetical protein GOVbin2006_32 [Prokaryotic dsDNA virus sp.]|nr:MAG: hypothetical protein GOVbin2006_32 [Prokaryotic dsDNA virus sp.]|tara:strand:- start:162 stop:527 length:366 start_codon:yes stop_codon:yes gene_type:complete
MIDINQIPNDFLDKAKKEGILVPVKLDVITYKIDNKIVGMAGIKKLGSTALFKCAYVLKEHRGKGIYDYLFKKRMIIAEDLGYKKMRAFCTKMSVNTLKRYGFNIKKTYKNGITQMTYENI